MPQNVPMGDGILAVRHTITGDSEEMIVTCGIGISSDGTINLSDTTETLFDHYCTAMQTTFCPSTTIVGATLYVQATGGFAVYTSTGAPVVGSSSGTALPPNVAVLAKKVTALGGRRGQGRMFLPGISEGFVDPNGALTSAAVTQIGGDLGSLFTLWSDDNAVDDLLLFHSNPAGDITPTVITAFTLDPKVATQRRRLR